MMADAGSIFSLTSFWVVVAISVIGWPTAIWMKRRRIARERKEDPHACPENWGM